MEQRLPQQQQPQQQQHPLQYSFLPSPHRCFLIDVQLFLQGRQSPPGSTTTLRILGIAVAVEYPQNSTSSSSCGVNANVNANINSNENASEEDDDNDDASMAKKTTTFLDPLSSKATTATIWLDDGTALVPMQVPIFMMENMRTTARVPWQGATLECIVRVVPATAQQRIITTTTPTTPTLSNEHNNTHKFSIVAEQISIVQDVHVELLWWYELTLRQNQQPSNTAALKLSQEEEEDDDVSPAFDMSSPFSSPPTHASLWDHEYSFDMGYPTRSVTAEDLYDVIHCDYQTHNNNHMHKNGGDGSTPSSSSPPMGVDQNDLALLFQLSPEMTESLLQELQLSGQVYRNPQGLYLPL